MSLQFVFSILLSMLICCEHGAPASIKRNVPENSGGGICSSSGGEKTFYCASLRLFNHSVCLKVVIMNCNTSVIIYCMFRKSCLYRLKLIVHSIEIPSVQCSNSLTL